MGGMGFVKKLGACRLVSLNPAYDDIIIDDECRTVGRILGKAE